jgi:hypothetical protein
MIFSKNYGQNTEILPKMLRPISAGSISGIMEAVY